MTERRHAAEALTMPPSCRRIFISSRPIKLSSHGQDPDPRRPAAARPIPISGAKNAALPLMAREPADRRDADPGQPAASRRHHHDGQPAGPARRRDRHGRRGAQWRPRRPRARADRRARSPRRRRPTTWCARCAPRCWCSGPLVARCGAGARLAARRLRHRHAAGRPAPQGPAGSWAPRSSCARAISRRARPSGLRGAEIVFPIVSVGATENLLMAATLAEGETVLVNAAREPEISDLAHCLIAMGAQIEGIGTDTLTIQGVDRLHGAHHAVIPDRIETGTYAMAAAITGGEVELIGARLEHLDAVADVAARGRRARRADRERASRVRRANGAADRRRCHDRALPGLPDRPAGAVHGADGDRRGRLDDHRDDLREPLHARARAGAHGRQHQPCTAPRRWCAACRG